MTSCDHTQNSALFHAKDYVTGDWFTLHKCEACQLAFTQPVPPIETLGRYYPGEYYGEPTLRRFPWVVETLQRRLYVHRVRWVAKHLPTRARRVIDIGCGKGFLLDSFRRKGWTVQGVELSEHSARHGREILGLNIHVGPIEALRERHFDAAILWHVLEHTPDPGQLLESIHRLMDPGGVLLVSVPNFGSPEARLTTSAWFHLDVPRHLVHFTPKGLSLLLEIQGFEIVARLNFAPEFDLFSFVQSGLNLLNLPPNHLYRLLRGQGAKLPSTQDRWWHTPISLGLAIPLALAGLVYIPIAGWMGYGSTLSILARKREDPRF